jgi:arsenate reductase
MSKLTLYYHDACSKCRKTLELLRESGRELEVVEYVRNPPSPEALDRLLTLLGAQPEDIVRKGEELYEELGLATDPPRSREEWIQVLILNPILIERPIVSDGRKAVIARPPEKARELLS